MVRHQSWAIGGALALALAACGGPQANVVGTGGDRVTGTAIYREPLPLPPDAELDVWIADLSTPTTPARIAQGSLPMRELETEFALRYDDDQIVEDHTYVIKAAIRSGKQVVYQTDADTLVITRGHSSRVSLVLRPIIDTPTSSVAPGAAPPGQAIALPGSSWTLEGLAGTPAIGGVEATLEFLEGDRVSGNASCNRFTGTVKVTGTSIAFSPLAATRMACASAPANAQEAAYLKALNDAEGFVLEGTSLQIFSKGQAAPLRFARKP